MLLNRLKLFLLSLVVLFLTLLFWHNQELLSLKLLCPDVNQSCLYQTPKLPLAIWMLIFTVAGVITSFVWQLLNYLGTKGASKSKSSASTRYSSEEDNIPRGSQTEEKLTNTQSSNQSSPTIERSSVKTKTTVKPTSVNNFTKQSDWEDDSPNDDWNTEESTPKKGAEQTTNKQIKENKSDKASKDSARTQSSDAAYYYRSRPVNESKDQEADQVYDANYRVINPSLRKTNNEKTDTRQDDDDDEWI